MPGNICVVLRLRSLWGAIKPGESKCLCSAFGPGSSLSEGLCSLLSEGQQQSMHLVMNTGVKLASERLESEG